MPLPVLPLIFLAVASIVLVLGRFFRGNADRVSKLLSFAVLLFAAYSLSADPLVPHEFTDGVRVRHVWNADSLARAELWLVVIFGSLAVVAFSDSADCNREGTTGYGYLLFAVAGLMLVTQSNDLLAMGLSIEIVSLTGIAIQRRMGSHAEKAPAADWIARLATALMWLGIALLSNSLATTDFDSIRIVLTEVYDPGIEGAVIAAPSKMVLLSSGLIVMSLFARMGLVPFHLGFYFYLREGSTSLGGISILTGQLTGVVVLTRLFGHVFVGIGPALTILTMTVFLATCALSSGMSMRGLSPGIESIPRWLISLTLLQNAWLLMGLMIISAELQHPGIRWGAFPQQNETLALFVFSQFASLLATGSVTWVLSHLVRSDRATLFLEDIKGLGHLNPVAAITLSIGLASAIGLPLTAGFWGRWLMLLAGHCVHQKSNSSIFAPHDGLRYIMLIGVVATLPVAYVAIQLAREMFLESPLARPIASGGRGPLVAGSIAAIAIVALGIAPQLVIDALQIDGTPRVITPPAEQMGSGRNSLGSNL